MKKEHKLRLQINLIPIIGIIVFILLYIYASTLYPGGSQADLDSKGFDWVNNYWCNLTMPEGLNGVENKARPVAIVAMTILCLSLMVFFYQYAEHSKLSLTGKKVVKVSSILSMGSALFMFTDLHDLMIVFSSLFGLFVCIGLVTDVFRSNSVFLKWFCVICSIMLLLTNVIYYTNNQIGWLPLIQKITMLFVLIWIVALSRFVRKRILATQPILTT